MSAAANGAGARPDFATALGVWARLGVLSFGGPAGQIALMHRMLVEERGWLEEAQFLRALNFCMLLPGPEAMQLATYAGWRLHGWRGGLAAGLFFVLPGALLVTALAAGYAALGQVPAVQALFLGVKAAVLAIVVEALIRIARRALKHRSDWLVAAAAFLAIFVFDVPFPVIVLAAALIGAARVGNAAGDGGPVGASGAGLRALKTAALWAALWFLPLLALAAALGRGHVLVEIGWFFSKLAVVTFGGAYAVLAYMAQAAVQQYGWLDAGAMLDGLGLAETTPGPLILVTQFVGYQAGFGSVPGGSLWLGLAGAVVTLWVTFVPCFLWVLSGAPFIETLAGRPRLAGALAGITAAVVGVILNLSLWFGLRVLFAAFETVAVGPARLELPLPGSLDGTALAIVALAAVLVFAARLGIVATLGLSAAAALAAGLLL